MCSCKQHSTLDNQLCEQHTLPTTGLCGRLATRPRRAMQWRMWRWRRHNGAEPLCSHAWLARNYLVLACGDISDLTHNIFGCCHCAVLLQGEEYQHSVTVAYGGIACATAHGTTRFVTACTNATPCPINCVGAWQVSGTCNGAACVQ